ncbi:flagellar hook basal-body protein [Methylobacillus arboreus]|uniref:flagellar hook-basal body protein n=1 Tax=Methylobacillus arboreus TaxID=755170 RepID=UPI001E3DEE77|nr:flagellar hook basal-body protein [Methylobacillus arboreus]MCB5191873.1 flagellar hook basal-body protein [Methylobacillus arboreus]
MIDPVSLTALSMQHDLQRMSVVANNAANALTTGFKREYLVVSGQMDASLAPVTASDPTVTLAPLLRSMTDQHAGVAKQTGGALDIALLGEGYFEIQTANGLAYSRQGNFRLDEFGRLMTQRGDAVMGTSGEIVLMSPNPTIDRTGKIFEDGKQVAQLKIVSFDAGQPLTNIGGGLAISETNAIPHLVSQPRLAQGQLESSNVDSTMEMVRMMETFRHFESSQRVLQAYDEMNDKTLRNLGQF